MKSRVMIGLLLAAGLAAGAHAQGVPSAFTYQGKLTDAGQPANGQYDLFFRLYPTDNSIFPLGDAITLENVQVLNGIFTVSLDFGQYFNGDPRWMAISVRGGAQTGAYTVLSPRQQLAQSPYAITARAIAMPLFGAANTSPDLFGEKALIHMQQSGAADALLGETSGTGNAVEGRHTATSGIVYAVHGETSSTSGRGVFGHAIWTSGSQAFGVHGQTESSTSGASGMRAVANGGGSVMTYGILAQSNSSGGVGAHGQGKFGVYGLGTTGGIDAIGVLGITSQTDGVGVNGRATGSGGTSTGVLGQAVNGGWAGFFEGDVRVAGLMWANDKNFLIDNPANPAEEFLIHACIESDERRNLYDGVVSLDGQGTAVVQLPEWFDKLNASFRYQLTCVGGHAPVYVSREIENNRFVIAGGMQGLKVSWQVTGVRIDPYAQSRPFQAVRAKEVEDRGRFVSPEAYGLPRTQTIGRFPNPAPTSSRKVSSTDPMEAAARGAAAEGTR